MFDLNNDVVKELEVSSFDKGFLINLEWFV